MYTSTFQEVTTAKIVNSLQNQGFFVLENAITEQYINELLQEVNFDQVLVNANDVGVVWAKHQKFLTHCLAQSKQAYDLITSPEILAICKNYFQDRYVLINHRIYQTHKISHMPWHTDNNQQVGRKLSSKHNRPGLLFLFYLSDVTTNPFQLIKNSHLWSQQYNNEIYISDQFVKENYQKDILTFPLKKGSLIICNIHAVHRAEPFQDDNYTRTTLLFQVDQVGSDCIGHGEKNLVNTEFLDDLTPEIMNYLGFGYKTDYPAFPNTSVATLTTQDIITLQRQLLPSTLKAMGKNLALNVLPGEVLIQLKRWLWNFNKQQTNRVKVKESE
ncbi:MAG: phytanoyl-CoA dioxygenase family protein [Cyanobacteriota bacterium]|nr:phytanoyl-CoA dioxygenase family protein [Cyanobacteriota bacterium]